MSTLISKPISFSFINLFTFKNALLFLVSTYSAFRLYKLWRTNCYERILAQQLYWHWLTSHGLFTHIFRYKSTSHCSFSGFVTCRKLFVVFECSFSQVFRSKCINLHVYHNHKTYKLCWGVNEPLARPTNDAWEVLSHSTNCITNVCSVLL